MSIVNTLLYESDLSGYLRSRWIFIPHLFYLNCTYFFFYNAE